MMGDMQLSQAAEAAARHPQDPDPVPSTKAVAAYTLSLVALATAPFFGGVVPAALAIVLSRQADADIVASDGFLLGAARSHRARKLARIALAISGLVALAILVAWVYHLAISAPQVDDIDPNVN